jgi:hypothetical protein
LQDKSPDEANNETNSSADCFHPSCTSGRGGTDLGLVAQGNVALIGLPE